MGVYEYESYMCEHNTMYMHVLVYIYMYFVSANTVQFQVFACNIVAIIKYVDHFTKAIYYSVQTCILCTLTYMYVQTETNYCLECKKCKYNTLLNFSVCIVAMMYRYTLCCEYVHVCIPVLKCVYMDCIC